jgi:hypothetical protein
MGIFGMAECGKKENDEEHSGSCVMFCCSLNIKEL